MPKTYTVRRDQAVWERETFTIEVSDDIPLDQHDEYLYEQLDRHDRGELALGPYRESAGCVEHLDAEYEIQEG